METIKKTIALFETPYGTQAVDILRKTPIEGWMRLSQATEVFFEPLTGAEIVQHKIAAIKTQREKVLNILAELNQKEQELLALEHIEP